MLSLEMFSNALPLCCKAIRKYPLKTFVNRFGNRHSLLSRVRKYAFMNIISTHYIRRVPLHLSSIAFAYPLVVNAWGRDPKEEEKKVMRDADHLFDENKFDELFVLLKSQPSWYDNAQVLWRVARCEFHMSKNDNDANHSKQLLNDAYIHIERSLELDNQCGAAHKWAAILLDAVSTLNGTRARIEQLMNIKNHMEKAIQYSPDDPTAHYLLGQWHYSCNQVSWVERKLAAIIYGSLPDASLEEALSVLEKAEQIESDFYSKNKVLIAQVLMAMNRDKDRTIELLSDVIEKYKSSTKWDDIEAVKEAKEALHKLGVKVK